MPQLCRAGVSKTLCEGSSPSGGALKRNQMTAIEAIIYCLGFVSDVEEDGAFHSQTAYDCNGEPHWFAWKNDEPTMCSESPHPFSKKLEPYRLTR